MAVPKRKRFLFEKNQLEGNALGRSAAITSEGTYPKSLTRSNFKAPYGH